MFKITSSVFCGKNHQELKQLLSKSDLVSCYIDGIRSDVEHPLTGNDLTMALFAFERDYERDKHAVDAYKNLVKYLASLGSVKDFALDAVANWAITQASFRGSGVRAENILEHFKSLLAHNNITGPDPKVLEKIQTIFSSRFISVTSPDQAQDLYNLAKSYPGTTTSAQIEKESGIKLNGLLSADCSATIITGIEQGKPILVKVLSGDYEKKVAELLDLNNPSIENLMPMKICKVTVAQEDVRYLKISGPHLCAIMPHYPTDLARVGRLLSPEDLYKGGIAMEKTLTFIHSKQLVHMDVKPANIFLTTSGNWILGDYGSMVQNGTKVVSTTESFLPEHVIGRIAARPGFDFYMLAASLVALVTPNIQDILKDKTLLSDTEKIKNIISGVDHVLLQNLVLKLLDRYEQ